MTRSIHAALIYAMRSALFAIALSCAGTLAFAQDEWPQFRGPTGQGTADLDSAPITWSEGDNIAWKAEIPGVGFSSPVVSGSRVWVTTAERDGSTLRAVCVDRNSGEIIHNVEVFQLAIPPKINVTNSYASPSPVIEGDRLWVCFGTMGTACLDASSGEVLWRNNELVLAHKEGPGSSPIIHDDLLILNCDGMDVRYVAALNKRTGEMVWKTDRTAPPAANEDMNKAYSTPLVVHAAGREELVSPAAMHVAAYDPTTGDELWKVNYPQGFSNVPRPVYGDGLVFVSTGYVRPTLLAIRPGGTGDVTDSRVVWESSRQAPTRPSPLYLDGRLYVVSDRGVLTCYVAATGETLYTARLGGDFAASPIYAAGHLYFCDEDGVTSVIAPGDEFQRVARNELSSPIKASPAAAGNEFYLRTTTALYRIEDAATANEQQASEERTAYVSTESRYVLAKSEEEVLNIQRRLIWSGEYYVVLERTFMPQFSVFGEQPEPRFTISICRPGSGDIVAAKLADWNAEHVPLTYHSAPTRFPEFLDSWPAAVYEQTRDTPFDEWEEIIDTLALREQRSPPRKAAAMDERVELSSSRLTLSAELPEEYADINWQELRERIVKLMEEKRRRTIYKSP